MDYGQSYGSLVVLTSSGLKWGLSSQPEIEARVQRWEHQILATRSVTRTVALQLCRKEFPQRQKEVKQVKYLLGGKRVPYVFIGTWADSDGERVETSWQVKSLVSGHFFWVPLGQSFWFARFTVHIWYISGSSYMLTCISWPRWILPQRPRGRASLGITPLWPLRKLSMHVWSGRSPDFENEKYAVWAGPSLLP